MSIGLRCGRGARPPLPKQRACRCGACLSGAAWLRHVVTSAVTSGCAHLSAEVLEAEGLGGAAAARHSLRRQRRRRSPRA